MSTLPAGTVSGVIPTQIRIAAGIIALEAVALVAAAGFLVDETVTGAPRKLSGSLALIGFALACAALLALCARGLLRLRPAARTPVFMLQLFAVPVAWSVSAQGNPEFGVPIVVAAVITIYLLFTPQAREALDRHID